MQERLFREHQLVVYEKRMTAFFRLLDELTGPHLDATFEELLPRLEGDTRFLKLSSTTSPVEVARDLFTRYIDRKV